MCVEAKSLERIFEDSLKSSDASLRATGCCSVVCQPRIQPVSILSRSFCVKLCAKAASLERVFEDPLRGLDASVGVTGCCSATYSALNYVCHADFASNVMCIEASGK